MTRPRRVLAAAATLALVATAAPARPLHGQTPLPTAQDTATPPWVIKTPGTRTTPTPGATAQAVADSAGIREAIARSLFEVRVGTLAAGRSKTAAVQQFAREMVADHGSMGRGWTSLASRNGLPAGAAMSANQQQTVEALSKVSGAEFDRAYLQAMVQDHDQGASALGRLASSARSAEVRQLAASAVTTTRQHLATARQVAGELGDNGAVASSTPTSGDTGAEAGNRRRTDADDGNRSEGMYAQELAYGHILQVKLAQLAQKRAKRSDVRQFADQVAGDLPEYLERWTDLASRHGGVQVNPNMGRLHRDKLERVEKASKGNFDRAYLDTVVEQLGAIVPYLQKEGRDSRAADIRKLADDELPSLREKLSAAQRLDRREQASAKGKGRSLSEKE